MKRSRRSEYDKKRNRSKKSSERKFQFSTNPTDKDSDTSPKKNKDTTHRQEQKLKTSNKKDTSKTLAQTEKTTVTSAETNTINRPIEFEVFSKNDKQYQQRTAFQKKKSPFSKLKLPLISSLFIIALFGLVFMLNIVTDTEKEETIMQVEESANNEYVNADPKKKDSLRKAYKIAFLKKDSLRKASRKEYFKQLEKPDISRVIVGNNVNLKEKKARNSTYKKRILPNVTVHIPKELPIYDTRAIPNVSILAKNSDEYFFYSKEKKENGKNIVLQWIGLRKSLIDESLDDYFNFANSERYDKGNIVEVDFSIIIDGFIFYGAATLIKHNNQYHFFHLMSVRASYEKPNYKEVREKLYTYLKMELPKK